MYRIGELAKMAEVTPDTIRYYEKQQMMEHEVRTEGGFRLYTESDLQRLKFIRHARQLGFSLESIRELLSIRIDPEHHTCQESKGIVQERLQEVEARIAEFNASDARYLHPSWLLKRLQKAYPEQWQSIVEANNQRPPMWLRINRTHHSRDSWLALLDEAGMKGFPHADYPDAVRLETPAPVHALPGFEDGWVTVQDASAQGCMTWLAPQNGEHILDLCAAPGGKTTHILEVAPEAQVVAVDIDEQRLSRVYDNLKRLGMKATVKQGDGRYPSQWCGEQQFDRILLDAPCSATGVIRRHPDIKWLRRDRDIPELAQLQSEILDAIWPHLKTGGTLVYATCSVLPEENSLQIKAFLQRTADAELCETGTPEQPGKQNLPGAEEGDGFFYAKLIKK